MKKIFYSIMIAIIIISMTTTIFAGDIDTEKYKDIYNGNSEELNTIAGKILGIIQTVGIAVAVGMLMIVGVRYIMMSPEGKAEYKKTAITFAIGAALLFSGSAIIGIVRDIVDQTIN